MTFIFIDELEIKLDYIKEDAENLTNLQERVVVACNACDRMIYVESVTERHTTFKGVNIDFLLQFHLEYPFLGGGGEFSHPG